MDMFRSAAQDRRMLSTHSGAAALYAEVTILLKASQGVRPADMRIGAEAEIALRTEQS